MYILVPIQKITIHAQSSPYRYGGMVPNHCIVITFPHRTSIIKEWATYWYFLGVIPVWKKYSENPYVNKYQTRTFKNIYKPYMYIFSILKTIIIWLLCN